MDDEAEVPLEFANQVVEQFADHLVGRKPKPNDFSVIRVTFRKLRGSWVELCSGNILHLMLLSQVVRAWGSRSSD